MIFAGGISVYKLDAMQALNDGVFQTVYSFISCQDQYNTWFNNATATSGPNLRYIANPVVRAGTVASCVAPQAPMILLVSFTGLFVLGTAVAGIWAAFKYTRAAVFSSGISIGYTVALLITSIVFGLALFAPMASRAIDCRSASSEH